MMVAALTALPRAGQSLPLPADLALNILRMGTAEAIPNPHAGTRSR